MAVDLNKLNPHFHERINVFLERLFNAKIAYKITSGYRTLERQRELWIENNKNPELVAEPGKSLHNFGRAIDIIIQKEYKQIAKELAEKLGFYTKVYKNKNHIHIDNRYDKEEPDNTILISSIVLSAIILGVIIL